jgi:CRP/FNR family transcriptional regulator, cyclic AMP receptor protein
MEIPAGTARLQGRRDRARFFVIVDGKVEITRKGRKVAMRGSGRFVGEIALLEQTPRTATVTAKTPLHLFVLTDRHFRSLLDVSPSVERKVLRALARRVVELSKDPTVA